MSVLRVLAERRLVQCLLEDDRPVGPMSTALRVRDKGLSQRAVSAELQSATIDEGTIGKNDFIAVSRGHARNRSTKSDIMVVINISRHRT